MKVNILDEDSFTMDIELRIRETTCRRGSGEVPATCDFQRGYYVVRVGGKATSPENNAREHLSSYIAGT